MPIEYEAKFLAIDKNALRETLTASGYHCTQSEFLFKRQTFDNPPIKIMA